MEPTREAAAAKQLGTCDELRYKPHTQNSNCLNWEPLELGGAPGDKLGEAAAAKGQPAMPICAMELINERDELLVQWCDSWNEKIPEDRRKAWQENLFDKTNTIWPTKLPEPGEMCVKCHAAYGNGWEKADKHLHQQLDQLNYPPSNGRGSFIRLRDQLATSTAQIAELTRRAELLQLHLDSERIISDNRHAKDRAELSRLREALRKIKVTSETDYVDLITQLEHIDELVAGALDPPATSTESEKGKDKTEGKEVAK